jgi:hypothetical protein
MSRTNEEDVTSQAYDVDDDLVSGKPKVGLNNPGGNNKNHFDNAETVPLFIFFHFFSFA